MGIFSKLRSTQPAPSKHRAETASVGNGFTVIDVETTGLSARQHRVLEIAVVRTDSVGRVTGEWSRRIDPEGPVGATHIHGITADDVRGAPKFGELIPDLNAWFQGTVVVAHNATFDLAFMRAEYSYAGWELPWLPTLCTLEASNHYLPNMDRRRLADCCTAARVQLRGAHSALGDARATAGLLAYYLDPRTGTVPHPEHLALIPQASGVVWPCAATRRPQTPQAATRVQARIAVSMSKPQRVQVDLVELLADFSLVDALDEGAPPAALAYLETLAGALEDGEISEDEVQALNDVAEAHGLTNEDRVNANRSLLVALSHLALEDGLVSRAEKAELVAVSEMLGLPKTVIAHTLDQAEAARHARLGANLQPLPSDWAHGEPLRVGDKVAFTGCDEQLRARLELHAEKVGVRVMGNVSTKTAMLITDGGFVGIKAEAAQQAGCTLVHPTTFEVLLNHLQPAVPRKKRKAPRLISPALAGTPAAVPSADE
jgi:DNA polymerase-3 subunit epsilon